MSTHPTEDRAISPIIGVVLMVAVTVLLASTVAVVTVSEEADQHEPNVTEWKEDAGLSSDSGDDSSESSDDDSGDSGDDSSGSGDDSGDSGDDSGDSGDDDSGASAPAGSWDATQKDRLLLPDLTSDPAVQDSYDAELVQFTYRGSESIDPDNLEVRWDLRDGVESRFRLQPRLVEFSEVSSSAMLTDGDTYTLAVPKGNEVDITYNEARRESLGYRNDAVELYWSPEHSSDDVRLKRFELQNIIRVQE